MMLVAAKLLSWDPSMILHNVLFNIIHYFTFIFIYYSVEEWLVVAWQILANHVTCSRDTASNMA